MKIAVFSDSHGEVENLSSAVDFISPDTIFHLGDYRRDADELWKMFHNIPIYAVAGNCDGALAGRRELTVQVGGKTFFLCHGHTYGVKNGLEKLRGCANRADCVLFGHTHRAWCEMCGNVIILNPGTMSWNGGPSCAVIEVENDKIEFWFANMIQGYWESER